MSAAAFDAQRVAFVPEHTQACRRLCEDALEVLGFISSASNGTMLCRLGSEQENLYAIYKPGQHERPLWDFPGELYLREVAAYEVSEFLGWGIVPPTVVRDGPRGPGSVQLFVPHDPAEHYFTLADDDEWDVPLAQIAVFDMVTNNADRKGGHVLRQIGQDRLYGIDNGLTFNVEAKLRTVVWDQAHIPIAQEWKADLCRLQSCLQSGEVIAQRLGELLTTGEVAILARRAEQVASMTAIPDIDPDDRWYPWPPI
ncbi:MAG: SCO1664 family protein [Euzebya sp.]